MKRRELWTEMIGRLFISDRSSEETARKQAARNITFQVTEDCNLKCTYCYQGAKTKKVMSLETGKKIVDMLLEGKGNIDSYMDTKEVVGVVLDFIGGEPFLQVDLIDQIMDYFEMKAFEMRHPWATRFMISISSNGTLYFTDKVQKFIEKWKRHLSLSISVDGNKELHDACRLFPDGAGSYDIALKAALDYKKRFGNVGTKMTIAPGNVSYIYDAVCEMIKNGYTDINLNCVYEEGWTLDHAKIMYKELIRVADMLLERDNDDIDLSIFADFIGKKMDETDNKNWCGGTGLMLAFDPDGRAYPCLRYMASSLNGEQEPYSIGSLCDGIKCKQCDIERAEFLDTITRKSQSTEECWNCSIASGCAWCSGYNYQVFGTPNKRATFICVMHRARVLANCYYLNKLAIKNGSPTRQPLEIREDWGREIAGDDYDMIKKLSEVNGDVPC